MTSLFTQFRVPGHGLQREGRAFDAEGRYEGGPVGFGLCSCGQMSPKLDTTADRKRWHVVHKTEVLTEKARRERRG